MSSSELKERLRGEFLARRASLAFEDVRRMSSRVAERLLSLPSYRSARRLALYSSFRGEVLTDEIFQHALSSKREVYFPKVSEAARALVFCRVTGPEDLGPGSYNIAEPAGIHDAAAPGELDLIVVPGVAFDLTGARLGYGKGYYDASLRAAPAPGPGRAGGTAGGEKAAGTPPGPVVALAYEFQVYGGTIPVEDHDVRVDTLVTEKRVYDFRGRRGG
ncbi:MAG: 5-formyltetrahydrofolate cyclo-ligase [Thermodesulfobacteriota bacterium]